MIPWAWGRYVRDARSWGGGLPNSKGSPTSRKSRKVKIDGPRSGESGLAGRSVSRSRRILHALCLLSGFLGLTPLWPRSRPDPSPAAKGHDQLLLASEFQESHRAGV